MSDDLISRKEAIDILGNMIFEVGKDLSKSYLLQDARERIIGLNTSFDKEKVIEELKSAIGDIHYTEDGSFNGKCIEDFEFIQAKTALEIVEKGGIG